MEREAAPPSRRLKSIGVYRPSEPSALTKPRRVDRTDIAFGRVFELDGFLSPEECKSASAPALPLLSQEEAFSSLTLQIIFCFV